jgi:ADP-ribosylglycohydrolase
MGDKTLTYQITSLLLGIAAGDALGVPVEFRPRGSFRVRDMQGYGTHNQPPGTWSDDTSLALCLAGSLSRGFDLSGIARNFVRWHNEGAFTVCDDVFDIGISTAKAVNRLKSGTAPEKARCVGANENGNGSLMRIAPLVFYLRGKPETERFKITKAVSSVTHAHEWPVASCLIYTEYLLKLLDGMDRQNAYWNLQGDFQKMYINGTAPAEFDRILRTDISALTESAIRSGGFVIDTLGTAFWCFLTTDTYRDAVLKAVNLGEDTDTTAAITGGIAGLFYGKDAIPTDWLRKLAGVDGISRIAVSMADAAAV